MTEKEYKEFKKLMKANDLLIKKNLNAAIALSKIIDNYVKKVTPPKQTVKRKIEISPKVMLEAAISINNNQN